MNIKKTRISKGYKQKDVSDYLGITRAAWANLENEKRQPDPETLILLSDFFGVTVDYLLGHEKEPTTQEGGGLAEKDRKLIEWFRSLPPEKQKAVLALSDGPEELAD